ncbi:Phloem protein 2-like [Dillenia turbinata]|uniref:Phloem protein 2-like n=1 Tax=Dillenia turbinata TaxID=194707 RepID=A0AAN8UWD7_9MAGN
MAAYPVCYLAKESVHIKFWIMFVRAFGWTNKLGRNVAVLLGVIWLEIRAPIKSSFLTPNTTYAAYLLVFKLEDDHDGFTLDFDAADASVGTDASTSQTRSAFLTREKRDKQSAWARVPMENINQKIEYPNKRTDGWFEVELGEIFIERGDDGDLEMSVFHYE